MTRTEVVPVQAQIVPVHSPENAQNEYFLLFFMHFSIPNHIYTSYTLQNHFKFILYPQLYSNHLSMDTFLPNSFMNHFKTILIWFMTHIQTKHQDLLGFVLNPNSISFHLTMNPTQSEDSILILFLVGLTNLNFKKPKSRMQFLTNPRFGTHNLF